MLPCLDHPFSLVCQRMVNLLREKKVVFWLCLFCLFWSHRDLSIFARNGKGAPRGKRNWRFHRREEATWWELVPEERKRMEIKSTDKEVGLKENKNVVSIARWEMQNDSFSGRIGRHSDTPCHPVLDGRHSLKIFKFTISSFQMM